MQRQPKKSLGQHFLTDPNYCRKIIQFAEIQPSDVVVEIGPGTGQLTQFLLSTAQKVLAVEFDRDMIQALKERFGDHSQLTLVEGNVLQLDWGAILETTPVKIVGNLPYNIATRILTQTPEIKDRFQSFTFMVQKEVAQRILARPGTKDYGFFTLLMEFHYDRMKGFDVPPGAFRPPPKVVSHVMKIEPRKQPHAVADYDRFVDLLKAGFRHRRKTLVKNMRSELPDIKAPEILLARCGIPAAARPENVTLEQYICLAQML